MSEPLSIVIQTERDDARTIGLAAGLLIGGATTGRDALRALDSSLALIEQASRHGARPRDLVAETMRLEREAAALLARLVALRVGAESPADTLEAA